MTSEQGAAGLVKAVIAIIQLSALCISMIQPPFSFLKPLVR